MDWQLIVLLSLFAVSALAAISLAIYTWNQRRKPSLIDALNEAVIALDSEDRVVILNPAAEEILGRSDSEVIGQVLEEFLPSANTLLRSDTPSSQTDDMIVIGEGEARRIFELRLSPWQSKNGRSIGRLVTLHDVTVEQQLEKSLLSEKQLLKSLVAVARATAERPTVQETLQNALDVAIALTDAEAGNLLLLSREGVVTHSVGVSGPGEVGEQEVGRRIAGKGLLGWVVEQRQMALIEDTRQDDRTVRSLGDKDAVRSALAVPIASQESLLGVLTLSHSEPARFHQQHAAMLQAAADQIAAAAHNARQYDDQRLLADRQATLYEVLRAVGSHLDPDAVVRAATDAVDRLTNWPAVAIWLPSASGSQLIIRRAAGLLADCEGEVMPASEGVVGRAMRLGESQCVPDVRVDPDYQAIHPQIRSQLAVPLRRGERVMGILDLQSDQPNAFKHEDVQLAISLGEAIALTFDNARFHSAMRKHAMDLNALYTVNRMIGRSLVLEDMLSKALYSALTSLGYGFGLISLVDQTDGHLTLAAERGLPPEMSSELQRRRLEGSFCAYVNKRAEAVAIGDLEQDSRELRRLRVDAPAILDRLKKLEVRACVGIPLHHQRHVLGVLCMFSRHSRTFLADDLDLQMAIGHQIAMAVTNLRLFRTIDDERSLLQALIESSRDGIIMIGAHQRILVINQPALDFLRLPGRPDVWINRSVVRVLMALRHHAPVAVRDAVGEFRRVAKRSKLSGEGEIELPPRVIRWLNLPVTAGTTSLGRLIVLHDVTDERMVDRVREDLIHTMVHDLRNPLTSIFGSLEFLENEIVDLLSLNQQQVLEIARSNSQQMVEMVNAILDISRLESGRMPLDQTPISMSVLVSKILRSQLPLAQAKNQRLESDVPADLPLAWADANLFERVLQNLVGNAIKFTPENGQITVSARAETRGRPRLLLSISDTGPGIPPEVEGRIFQKFATGRHAKSGSGLGLAFCKMVVEAHGGRIWVDSQPGQGATFKFTLPGLPAAEKVLAE